jgi:hypothetical protein
MGTLCRNVDAEERPHASSAHSAGRTGTCCFFSRVDWCVPMKEATMPTSNEQGSNRMYDGAQQLSESRIEREPSEEMPLERSRREFGMDTREGGKGLFERLGDSIKSPTGGATIAGAIGLGAATLFGVVETLVGAGAAYSVYRLVCKRQQRAR